MLVVLRLDLLLVPKVEVFYLVDGLFLLRSRYQREYICNKGEVTYPSMFYFQAGVSQAQLELTSELNAWKPA